MGSKLAHCLSHLFPELLVGGLENTTCVTITFATPKAFPLLSSVHLHVDFLISHFWKSFSIQLLFIQDFRMSSPNLSHLNCCLIETVLKSNSYVSLCVVIFETSRYLSNVSNQNFVVLFDGFSGTPKQCF